MRNRRARPPLFVYMNQTRPRPSHVSVLYFSCVDILGIAYYRCKRLVTLSTYRRYINECIYLSIYLAIVSSSLTFHCIFLVQVCVLSCLLTIK